MKDNDMKRILIPVISLFLGALLFIEGCGKMVVGSSDEYARVAEVSYITGEAAVFSGDGKEGLAAFKGMSLKQGDRMTTGSGASVKLDLDGGMEVILSENTTVEMSELKAFADSNTATAIKLDAGAVWADVRKKLETGSSFEIETPTAVMGVRGTKFSVVTGDGVSNVAVIEGKVEVSMEAEVAGIDGNITTHRLTAMVGKQEQLRVTPGIRSEEDFKIEPVTVDALDPFTLGIVRELEETRPDLFEGALREQLENLPEEDANVEKPSTSETPKAEPGPEETPAVESGGSPLPTVTPSDAAPDISLPEGYPEDLVPIIDGSELFLGQSSDGQFQLAFYTEKSLDEAFQYYEKIMLYYDNYSSGRNESSFSLSGEKDGYYVSVGGTMAGEGQAGVNLYISVSE
jgi:hypothetical protein